MATYRIRRAPSSLSVREFSDYGPALAYSKSIEGHKPIRRVTPKGVVWRVASLNPEGLHRVATVEKVADWVPPIWWREVADILRSEKETPQTIGT